MNRNWLRNNPNKKAKLILNRQKIIVNQYKFNKYNYKIFQKKIKYNTSLFLKRIKIR